MLSTSMERKIKDIISAINFIVPEKGFEVQVDLIKKTLIKEFSEDATGVALEQAVVEEIEYMIKDGLLDALAEDLGVSVDEIEKRFSVDKDIITKSITSRLNFQELIKEELEAYFHGQSNMTVQYNQEMMDTIQFLQLSKTIRKNIQMLETLDLQKKRNLSEKIIKELCKDFQALEEKYK